MELQITQCKLAKDGVDIILSKFNTPQKIVSLSDDKQADIIDAFNITSIFLDAILNRNSIIYFDNNISQVYPSERQLYKVNTSDTKASCL